VSRYDAGDGDIFVRGHRPGEGGEEPDSGFLFGVAAAAVDEELVVRERRDARADLIEERRGGVVIVQ